MTSASARADRRHRRCGLTLFGVEPDETNEDRYDKSEYRGDNESTNTNDETLIDVDVLNVPDEN